MPILKPEPVTLTFPVLFVVACRCRSWSSPRDRRYSRALTLMLPELLVVALPLLAGASMPSVPVVLILPDIGAGQITGGVGDRDTPGAGPSGLALAAAMGSSNNGASVARPACDPHPCPTDKKRVNVESAQHIQSGIDRPRQKPILKNSLNSQASFLWQAFSWSKRMPAEISIYGSMWLAGYNRSE